MDCEELKILKKSAKSTVLLVREKGQGQTLVMKRLQGSHPVYYALQNAPHPCLPALYEVREEDGCTVVLEEYIEGEPLGVPPLTERQFRSLANDLFAVLGFLHSRGIIHRDIKPSNLILANDGHIRLIDFDAARIPRADGEQDTRLLGTRGYAPPEQYGFAQTDERTDIYALGVTLSQILGNAPYRRRYLAVLRKCMNLDPGKRYQSIRQVRAAFSLRRHAAPLGGAALLLMALLLWLGHAPTLDTPPSAGAAGLSQPAPAALPALPMPADPHWDGETGTALWGTVPESGSNGDMQYRWRLYRDTPSGLVMVKENSMRGNLSYDDNGVLFGISLTEELTSNGRYCFEVAAVGDGERYMDSGYAMSDTFEFTGESAPFLPKPEGLQWNVRRSASECGYFAVWRNLGEYADGDSFNVRVYNADGRIVYNNIWTKSFMESHGNGGVWLNIAHVDDPGGVYRFTVQAQSSRPNDYRSRPVPDPNQESSPWLTLHKDDGR